MVLEDPRGQGLSSRTTTLPGIALIIQCLSRLRSEFPSLRRTRLKRLSELCLPRFQISFPSPRNSLSVAPFYLVVVVPSCPFLMAFPYPQPGDAGGCHSAPGWLTSTQFTNQTTVHQCAPHDEIQGRGSLSMEETYHHFGHSF